MTPKRAGLLNIAVSLAFAAAILGSSALISDPERAQTVTLLLVALWWVPFSLLLAPRSARSELACLIRKASSLFGR